MGLQQPTRNLDGYQVLTSHEAAIVGQHANATLDVADALVVCKSAHANDPVRLPRDRCYPGDGDAARIAGHHCLWPHYLCKLVHFQPQSCTTLHLMENWQYISQHFYPHDNLLMPPNFGMLTRYIRRQVRRAACPV